TSSQRRDQPFPIRTPVRCKGPIVYASCACVRAGAPTGRSTGGFGEVFVIAAIGPEAQADKRSFGRAVAAARARLDLIEEDQT
ncbi:MAG: hypothetical protein ACRDSN_06510, partial [Pseudonocardiaceae bacterium]